MEERPKSRALYTRSHKSTFQVSLRTNQDSTLVTWPCSAFKRIGFPHMTDLSSNFAIRDGGGKTISTCQLDLSC